MGLYGLSANLNYAFFWGLDRGGGLSVSVTYGFILFCFIAAKPILARWPGVRVTRFVYNLQWRSHIKNILLY